MTGPRGTGAIGIYVHFPYCRARCHYCAFYFVVGRQESRAGYVWALEREIARAAEDPRFVRRRVESVYFGGGTPSLMGAEAVGAVLGRIGAHFPLADDAEIGLEANPDGLTLERLRGLRAAGVNRLTLGWQSMRAPGLRALTRTHAPEDNLRSLEDARRAGFDNVGVDLIFGLPDQTAAAWDSEIDEVGALAPEHVSAYELTLEEGTRFLARNRKGRLTLPDEDTRARMFDGTGDVLARHGIERYEISNFARPGFECRHNVSGWRSGDLLGLGASAASHVENTRWTNAADLDEYVARMETDRDPAQAAEVLDEETWAAEDLYLGLRLTGGIDAAARLRSVPEKGAGRLREVMDRALGGGILERSGERVRLTRRGRLLADGLFEELLVPASPDSVTTRDSGP